MSRIYTAGFSGVSVSAAIDLITIKAGASSGLDIHEVCLGQITLGSSWQALGVQIVRLPSTVTITGGTSATIVPLLTGDASSACTVTYNNTTVATTSGAAAYARNDVWVLQNNYLYLPAPEDRISLQNNAAVAVRLVNAPSAAMTVSGTITWEEFN